MLVDGKEVPADDPTHVVNPKELKSLVASAAAAHGLPAPK